MKILCALFLVPMVAFAGDHKPDGGHDYPKPTQHQRQDQDQSQDQSQSQTQANSQSVEFNDRAQAPSVSAPSVFPTAACQSGISIGGSGPGGGGVLGFSFSKKECELVLLSQSYAAIGMTVAACEVLNKTKAAERVYGDHKPVCSNPIPTAVYSVAPQQLQPATGNPTVIVLDSDRYVTHDELKKAFEEAVRK